MKALLRARAALDIENHLALMHAVNAGHAGGHHYKKTHAALTKALRQLEEKPENPKA